MTRCPARSRPNRRANAGHRVSRSRICSRQRWLTEVRQALWEAVGGFDESQDDLADLDFWLRAAEHGATVHVLGAALLTSRRSRLGSSPREEYLENLERIYEKHTTSLRAHSTVLLTAKQAFLDREFDRQRALVERKRESLSALESVRQELADSLVSAGQPRHRAVDVGALRRTSPISPFWGVDRGLPLDRRYIHAFLERHANDIRGRVLEVKDPGYTRAYGGDRVTHSEVIDVRADNPDATIIADLSKANTLPSNDFDCFILTQTIGVIYDVSNVLRHAHRVLKPGGVLLCTAPAAGRISPEEGLDGDYWRFTEASLDCLFSELFPIDTFEIETFGNVLAAASFLYGLAPDDLAPEELDFVDPYFPIVYCVRAVKPHQAHKEE